MQITNRCELERGAARAHRVAARVQNRLVLRGALGVEAVRFYESIDEPRGCLRKQDLLRTHRRRVVDGEQQVDLAGRLLLLGTAAFAEAEARRRIGHEDRDDLPVAGRGGEGRAGSEQTCEQTM